MKQQTARNNLHKEQAAPKRLEKLRTRSKPSERD